MGSSPRVGLYLPRRVDPLNSSHMFLPHPSHDPLVVPGTSRDPDHCSPATVSKELIFLLSLSSTDWLPPGRSDTRLTLLSFTRPSRPSILDPRPSKGTPSTTETSTGTPVRLGMKDLRRRVTTPTPSHVSLRTHPKPPYPHFDVGKTPSVYQG